MKKEEAGARIRTADLLITKAKRTTIEMPVLAGLLLFAQQLTSFSASAVLSRFGRFSIAK
jgi:hypothetical protein